MGRAIGAGTPGGRKIKNLYAICKEIFNDLFEAVKPGSLRGRETIPSQYHIQNGFIVF